MDMAPADTLQGLLAVPVVGADRTECERQLGELRRLRGWVDGREAAVTSRLRELSRPVPAAEAPDTQPAPQPEPFTGFDSAAATEAHTRVGGVSAAEGRRRSRRAEMLELAPGFAAALAAGTISAEHVDAVAAVVAGLDGSVRNAVLARVDELLGRARTQTPEGFGRACRDLARRLERDHGISRNQQQRRDTYIWRRLNPATGMTEGRFALHPELADQLFGAVDREVAATIAAGEAAGDPEYVERRFSRNRLAAEALGELVAGGHQHRRPLEADITVVVDAATVLTGELHDHSLCETGDGGVIPPESARRLLCNGVVTLIVRDEHGVPFDLGRSARTANRAQRRALRSMYRTCAMPGCDVPFHRCEIHHIEEWERLGLTDLVNLLPLCARHHHLVHELRWRLQLDPVTRRLTVTDPEGAVISTARPDMFVDLPDRASDQRPVTDPSRLEYAS